MAREYKDSGIDWIGRIPKEWKVSQLKRFVSFQNGQDYKEIEVAEGFPVYGSGGVFAYANKYMYEGESILFGRKGTINRPLYINCKFWTVDTMYYTIPKKDVCAKFLYYVATTLPYDKYSTSTALPSMTQTILGNLNIAIPPISEQRAIVEYLDRKCAEIDSLIELQEQMIAQLTDYKQSVITEAVTKGLNPNAELVPSGIDWIDVIPKGWRVCRLKELGFLYGGLTGKSGTDFDVEENDKFAYFIPFTNIFNNMVIDTNKLYKVKVEDGEIQNEVRQGDLLFLMSSEDYEGIGKPALLDVSIHHLYLNSFCKGLRIVSDNVVPKFLLYMMTSHIMREQIRLEAKGFIRINLRQDKLMNVVLYLPPISEQKFIASYLDTKCQEIDSLIELKQKKIEALKEYKKSVIFEAVTGKTNID